MDGVGYFYVLFRRSTMIFFFFGFFGFRLFCFVILVVQCAFWFISFDFSVFVPFGNCCCSKMDVLKQSSGC